MSILVKIYWGPVGFMSWTWLVPVMTRTPGILSLSTGLKLIFAVCQKSTAFPSSQLCQEVTPRISKCGESCKTYMINMTVLFVLLLWILFWFHVSYFCFKFILFKNIVCETIPHLINTLWWTFNMTDCQQFSAVDIYK